MIATRPEAPLRAFLASTLRTKLQEPRSIRNGGSHGLAGISSAQDEQPAALMWEINKEERSMTWQELQAKFSWLSKLPFAMSMISDRSTERAASWMMDSAENREWWLTEFGLDLQKVNLGTAW